MDNESVNQWVDAANIRALAEGLMKPVAAPPTISPEAIYGSGFVGFAESGAPAATMVKAQKEPEIEVPMKAEVEVPVKEELEVPVKEELEVPVKEELEVPVKEEVEVKADPEIQVKPALGTIFPDATEVFESKEASVSTIEVRQEPKAIELTVTPTRKGEASHATPIARYPSPFQIATARDLTSRRPKVGEKSPSPSKGRPLSKRVSTFGIWLKGEIPAESYFICDRNGEVVVDEVGSSKLIKVARTLAHASASVGRQVGGSAEPASLHVKVSSERVLEVIPRHSHFGLVILGIIVPRALSRETVALISRSFGAAMDEK